MLDLTNGGKLKVSRGRMSAVWSRGRSPDRGTGERSPPKPLEVKIGKLVRQKTIGRQNDRLWKIIGRKTFLRKIIGWQKKTLGRKLKDRPLQERPLDEKIFFIKNNWVKDLQAKDYWATKKSVFWVTLLDVTVSQKSKIMKWLSKRRHAYLSVHTRWQNMIWHDI